MACRGLFVAGTDTDVGKTYVGALILRELKAAGHYVGAYKPVCSGSVMGDDSEPRWGDADQLAGAIEGMSLLDRVAPQRFHAAVAPHRAARLEGSAVQESLLDSGLNWWTERVEHLLVEGAGGLLSPLSDHSNNADVAVRWGFPVLIIARAGLGTLNHSLLTIEAAQKRGLRVAGVVFNCPPGVSADDPSLPYNREDLARLTNVPVLGTIATGEIGSLPFPPLELFDIGTPV